MLSPRKKKRSTEFTNIREEHRTLLLTPQCRCTFCFMLHEKLFLLKTVLEEKRLDIIRLIINLVTNHYENAEERIKSLSNIPEFYRRNMLNPKSELYRLHNEFMSDHNNFVNNAFQFNIPNSQLKRMMRASKRKNRLTDLENRQEFYRKIASLSRDEITREQKLYHFIMTVTRPHHNNFVQFHQTRKFSLLRNIHDMFALATNSILLYCNNYQLRQIVVKIKRHYLSVLPGNITKVSSRDCIIIYAKELFEDYRCSFCDKFGHNDKDCYRNVIIL